MNVVHINQSDVGGGAAIAGHRLHQGLLRLNVDSRLIAPESLRHEETTTVLPPMSLAERLFFKATFPVLPNQTNIWRTWKIFEQPAYREADVVNLHNLHTGLFFNYLAIPRLAREKPVVWTLHDMWAFTGHCSYSLECQRWREKCGSCPHPDMYPAVQWDNTAIELKLKKHVYAKSKLTIVAPSRWLADAARQSILGQFPVHHIPYGIDTEIYRPMNKTESRQRLGLPHDKTVLLFGCANLTESRKGMDILIELLRGLPAEIKETIVLHTIGHASNLLAQIGDIPIVQAGYLEDETDKACAYSAADVFISTTRADNLPLVLQESLACGTPMLATDVGGVGDIVRQGRTGFVAPPDNIELLRKYLVDLIRYEELRGTMAGECRLSAVEQYGLMPNARKYLELYNDLAKSPVAS